MEKMNSKTNETVEEIAHPIICIGRQLGSGGHDIGQMLARDFGAAYYDRELLNLAARESGLSERIFEQNDEHKSFLRTFLHIPSALSATIDYSRQGLSPDSFFLFQSDAIRKAAQQGPCVFVGRCADYVLRDFPLVTNVFISAPLEVRIRRVAQKRGISTDEACRYIEQGERRRADYYNYYTGKTWGMAQSYDLCIDSSILGLEATGLLIAQFIRQRLAL